MIHYDSSWMAVSVFANISTVYTQNFSLANLTAIRQCEVGPN